MNRLRIIEPGMLTTVQDLGRDGYASLGVPEGGAADSLSLRIGNRLVSNPDNAPALEFTLTGGVIEFEHGAPISICGGIADAAIEGSNARPADLWRATRLHVGNRLRIGPVRRGARIYLCVGGGIRVPPVLGSASTNLPAGFGGHEGRSLRAGDVLEFGPDSAPPPQPPRDARSLATDLLHRRTLRAIELPLEGRFDPESASLFWNSEFTVSNHSDRTGICLEGPQIPTLCAGRMVSEGMPHGAIEVPENGQPIVLGVDHPTTGGYPVIACIASVDLPILGQLRPREQVRFEKVNVEEARALFAEREANITQELPAA